MKPQVNWEKQVAIGTWCLLALTIVLWFFDKLLPTDVEHPWSLRFLSQNIVIRPWLALSITLFVAVTSWTLARKLAPKQQPIVALPQPVQVQPVASIPAILKVSIKVLPVEDSRREQIAIIMRNTGGSPALHIQVNDVHVSRNRVRFFDDIQLLAPGTSTKPIKPFVVEFPDSKKRDIALAMFEATYEVHRAQTNDAYDYQGGATFFDASGTKYQASWLYTFYPHRFKHTQIDDLDLVAELQGQIGPYLTVSDVGISEIPA